MAKAHDLGQERARWAWKKVRQVPGAAEQEYRQLAQKLPSYLQVSGLGQTLAFLFAHRKPGNHYDVMWVQLEEYLQDYFQKRRLAALEIVLDLEAADYRRATWEVMAVAEWLKRFAEGQIEKKKDKARGGRS